jgi:hypothetical protein
MARIYSLKRAWRLLVALPGHLFPRRRNALAQRRRNASRSSCLPLRRNFRTALVFLQHFLATPPFPLDAAPPPPPPPPLQPPPQSSPPTTPPRPVDAISTPAAAGVTADCKRTPGGSGHTLRRCARIECVVSGLVNRFENQNRVGERAQRSYSSSKSPLHTLCCVPAKYVPAKWFGAASIETKKPCSLELAPGVLSDAAAEVGAKDIAAMLLRMTCTT